MFLYIHGQVIIRAGVKLLSPGAPEKDLKASSASMMAKAWRTSQRSKAMRICGVLPNYPLQSQSEKQQCLSYVYWTIFCYTLIDLLACVPYYSMHVLNKHEGLSKKKKN